MEGVDKRYMASYKDYVNEHIQNFQPYSKKTITLDDKYALHYQQEGGWTLVCISAKPDVTLIEAFAFLEKIKEAVLDEQKIPDIRML